MNLTNDSNLSDLFLQRVRETPAASAYRQFQDGGWCDWTWADMAREVGRWQTALAAEGLQAGDRVALCMHNRVEWVLFDQAALGLGLVTVPLYFDDRPDNMAFCLNDAGARLLLLETGSQWSALKDQAQTVERAIILADAPAADAKAKLLKDWLPKQASEPRRANVEATTLASIVYTSGTTGRPKGVMLSHRNMLSNVVSAMRAISVSVSDRFLSFLPLSHMFERTAGYYSAMWAGSQTVYARSITQLAEDMTIQQPTILIAVPRIFERIWGRMQESMPRGSPKRRLFDLAVEIGWRRFQNKSTARDKWLWPLLKLLVANKLHQRLGGRIRLIVVGGAAFAAEHARVFLGLGLPILQGYGLTETAPVLACNRFADNDPFSVGRPLEGVSLRCDDSGELLARGPNIMLGYWHNASATAAAIDPEGWFHTGDIARLRDGRVYITGRVKDIIVLSNGEKVPPGDAEQAIMLDSTFEHVMVIGEGRPKLGLICVAQVDHLADLCRRANTQLREFPGYARIAHIACVPGPWTVDNGLLTPTLKTKRKEIEKRFAREIEAMYATSEYCSSSKG